MINSYKQLTGKYLKANKRRALLTIIGIVLSVALISTIGLFFKGMRDMQIESIKNSGGSYHLAFEKANDDLISKVTNNPKVSRSGLYAVDEDTKVKEGVMASEIAATDKALELLPVKIKEGRLPQNKNEAAIEKWALSYIDKNAKIGNKINFNKKDYTLVGILDNNIGTQKDNKILLLTKNNNINKENAVLLVEISSKTNLKAAVNELKKLGNKDKVKENSLLIAIEGGSNDNSLTNGLFIVISVIIGIVVISTIAVIYNSFQISVVERIRQFGLLRAVGTTPKQIRKIVLREATILAIIGVPIGLICGILAINIVSFIFKLIAGESILPTNLSISPMIMLLSAVVGLASIYLSALIPAVFAGKISPLVAISSRNSITKEKIKKRKSEVVQKIFGFEGAMAYKNIKRNRKRYKITVFSIVISVMLFVTFKSFMDMTLESNLTKVPNESRNIHFEVINDARLSKEDAKIEKATIDNQIIDNIKALNLVDKVYKGYNNYNFDVEINKSSKVKKIEDIRNIYRQININGNKKTVIDAYMSIYDKDALEASKKYLQSGNIDIDNFNEENGVIIINKNKVRDPKTNKSYVGPLANIKVGDEINIQYNDNSKQKLEFGKGKIKKVKVMAIVDNAPFDIFLDESLLKFITTEKVAKNLMEKNDINPTRLQIKVKDIKDEQAAQTDIESVIKTDASLRLLNNIDGNRQMKSGILIMQILVYGFVVVVSLIGCVNIINTLTTNIILRKREFATLKSIGLTQKGLKKMIILEGLIYGIVGAIYGSIIGCGLSYVMYKGLMGIREFPWMFPWQAIIMATLAAIVIGYMSVLSPLSRIKKENLIEAIREDF